MTLQNLQTLNMKQLKHKLKQRKLKSSGNKQTLLHRLAHFQMPQPSYHKKSHILLAKPFSKKDNFPAHIRILTNSFPNFHTNTPSHILSGTVTGHLYTLMRTTSHKHQHFTHAVGKFLQHLIQNNSYPTHLIIKLLHKFLTSHKILFKLNKTALIKNTLFNFQTSNIGTNTL